MLSDEEQLALVIGKGIFLLNRLKDGFLIHLYGLSKFYVEIWSNKLDTKVVKLVTLKSLKHLQPYIERIKPNLDKTE